jgi:hypothetical protein
MRKRKHEETSEEEEYSSDEDDSVGRSRTKRRSKGPSYSAWTEEEDAILRHCVVERGMTDWGAISAAIPGKRSRKQARERWHNQLDTSKRREEWTAEEEAVLADLQSRRGNKWALIAKEMGNRSDNDVKNRWHAMQRRKGGVNTQIGPRMKPPKRGAQHRSEVLSALKITCIWCLEDACMHCQCQSYPGCDHDVGVTCSKDRRLTKSLCDGCSNNAPASFPLTSTSDVHTHSTSVSSHFDDNLLTLTLPPSLPREETPLAALGGSIL